MSANADPFAGLRLPVRQRLHQAVTHLRQTGTLNRADLQAIGEVSVPQASKDIQTILERMPGLMTYDKSRKCYVAARKDPCHRCGGSTIIFECPEWDRSGGTCCPAGTQRTGCPGKSNLCPDCTEPSRL